MRERMQNEDLLTCNVFAYYYKLDEHLFENVVILSICRFVKNNCKFLNFQHISREEAERHAAAINIQSLDRRITTKKATLTILTATKLKPATKLSVRNQEQHVL